MENKQTALNKREIRRESLRRLTVCAMLIALYFVINRYLTISVGESIKIGLSFVAPMIAAMLYGPVTGAVVYGLGDLISALIVPQGIYHPGFTFTAALMGLTWGIFTHPKPFVRFYNKSLAGSDKKAKFLAALMVLVPAVVNCLVLGLFVNSIWLAQLYTKKTYWVHVYVRLPQEALMTAVNLFAGVAFLPVAQLLRRMGFVKRLNIGK